MRAPAEYIVIEAVRGGRTVKEPYGDIAIDQVEVWTDCSGDGEGLI